LHVPVALIYNGYQFYEDSNSLLQTLSLGNLGFSENNCVIKELEAIPSDGLSLECKSGQMGYLVDFGITTVFEN
jgi:hypothetical protein